MRELLRLYEITSILRGENGCPWDKAQTHKSITKDLVEEAYELIDAIDQEDFAGMKEELGDVLFQVIFHANLAEESGNFSLEDVAQTINEKLIRRHPHVFGEDKTPLSIDQIVNNWDEIKKTEKKKSPQLNTLTNIPHSFSALMKAEKLQSKAAKTGFDWEKVEDVELKLREELNEFIEEIKNLQKDPTETNKTKMANELGDIIFTIVNIARHLHISPEIALNRTNEKFIKRFNHMEIQAKRSGKNLGDLTLPEMEILWEKAKLTLNKNTE